MGSSRKRESLIQKKHMNRQRVVKLLSRRCVVRINTFYILSKIDSILWATLQTSPRDDLCTRLINQAGFLSESHFGVGRHDVEEIIFHFRFSKYQFLS